MKLLGFKIIVLFSLVAMLVIYAHSQAGSSPVASNIKAIQSEIQNAQRAFDNFRKSKGRSTQEFDAAINRLHAKINVWNASLKDPAQGYAPSKGLSQNTDRLNAYFTSLEKVRSQSDWRAVERDLARLDSAAKDLHSAALKLPDAPSTTSRIIPKPPTPGPSGTQVSPVTPKPKPEPGTGTVRPDNPPLPGTRGPSPKGPDDPRFAPAPAPPSDPNPPPDDGGAYRKMPSPMDEPAGKGAPPMLRKPAQPPIKIQEDIPKPTPTHIRKPTSRPRAKELTEAQKIQNFLRELEGANSLVEVRNSYEKGNFTDAEAKVLQQQVQKSGYDKKLKKLVEIENRKSGKVMRKNTNALLSARRHALERRQQQELKVLNQQAQTTLRHLQSKTSSQLSSLPVARETYRPVNENVVNNTRTNDINSRNEYLPPKEEVGEILTIHGQFDPRVMFGQHQNTGEVERSITITGNYFGDIEGSVDFIPYSLRDQRRLVPVSIISWSENQIIGKILLQEVESLLGYDSHPGEIRVKRRENSSGPKVDFSLYVPPPPPRITGVSTTEGNTGIGTITPGQTIIVMGEHFTPEINSLNSRYTPHLEYIGNRINIELRINEIHDTWISAEINPIEGVPASNGTLKYTRHGLGGEASVEMNFRPTLDTWVFEERLEHICWSFFGFKDTETLHDYTLSNGWTVVDHSVRTGGTSGHGCNWIERPDQGSTETAARVEYWCDLFSAVFCTSEVTIEGPSGIHWQ